MVLQISRPRQGAGRVIVHVITLNIVLFFFGHAVAADTPPMQATTDGRSHQSAQALTLRGAIDLALAASPGLQASRAGIDAAKGRELQAKLLINPEFSLEVENFQGRGPYDDFDSAELTYGISQEIELGGKRAARRQIAAAEREVAELDNEAASLDLIARVSGAFLAAVSAEQSYALASDNEYIARKVLDTVTERVNAAREPDIQKNKAEVTLSTSKMARTQAATAFTAALQTLSRFWDTRSFAGALSAKEFSTIPFPEALEVYESQLARSPVLARYRRLKEAREAELSLARAGSVPDPTVTLGVRQFRETDEEALVAGVSIPIPVWNRNQGEIARSGAEIVQTDSARRQAEIDQASSLVDAWSRWQSASVEAASLKQDIRPQAQKAFRLTLEGYQAGRFSYLEVLDAQRTLFDVRAAEIEAHTRLHLARVEVERLVAAAPSDLTRQAKP